MSDARITAAWFTDGWGLAYHNRSKAYGPLMPEDEQRRMRYALKRMYASQRREDDQRVVIGKQRVWFPTAKAS